MIKVTLELLKPNKGPRIVNVEGTGDLRRNGKTWKEYWENHTGEAFPKFCGVYGCRKNATVGAHVKVEGDDHWYIFPMCNVHNSQKKNFVGCAKRRIPLAPVKEGELPS